ncbi:MAG: glycosyl transferase family 1 [Enterobacteriaceae bacterium]
MNKVTIRVAKREGVKQGVAVVTQGDSALITFPSWEILYKTLSPKRMALLHAMAGAGELSFRDIAAKVERDVKAVHTDIILLLNCGLVERGGRGVFFPYRDIHFDFLVSTHSVV